MTADRRGARLGTDVRPPLVTITVAAALMLVSLALMFLSGTVTHAVGLIAAAAAWTAALLYFRSDRQLKGSPRYVGSSAGSVLFLLTVPTAIVLILLHSWFLARGLAV